jgi:large repetitive protein
MVGIEGDMAGKGDDAKAKNGLWRAMLAALLLLMLGPLASASAAPQLTITSPTQGSSTNQSTPAFAGEAEDTLDVVVVHIFPGEDTTSTQVQELEAPPSLEGTWGVRATALSDGTYTAVAQQLDTETAKTAESSPVTFTVDTVAPVLSLNSVSSPTNDSTPTLSGNAGVLPGDAGTVAVGIYAGTVVSGSPVASGHPSIGSLGGWSYTPASLPDGTYTAQAFQEDEAGNVGASGAVTFTVDTTPPAVTLSAVASLTNDATPSFSGGVAAAAGDLASVQVVVHKGTVSGAVAAEGSASVSGGTWSYTSPSLAPDGQYTVQAIQHDQAGNEGKSASATFTVDTTPPTVGLSAPAENAHLKSSRPNFAGAAGTAPGDVSSLTLNIYQGALAVGPHESIAISREGSSWAEPEGPSLADGTYTAQITQADSAGNVGSLAHTFTIDTVKPAVSMNAFVSPTNNPTPTFGGTAGTSPGDVASVKLSIFKAASEVFHASATPAGGGWTVGPVPALADGEYEARVEQLDETGNKGLASHSFVIDTTPPAVGLSAPAENAHLKSSQPSFAGAAGTAAGDASSLTLNIYQGGSAVGPHESIPISRKGSSWAEPEGPNLADGTYTAQITQADSAGNVGSLAHTFTIETNTPHPTLNALPRFTNDTTPSFTGKVDTTKGAVESVTLRIYRGTSVAESAELAQQPVTVASSGSSWSVGPVAHLADGTYTAQVEQENLAGTPGFSGSSTLTVDTVPPHVTLTAPESTTTGVETVSGVAGVAPGDRKQITVELFTGASAEVGEAFETITVNASEGSWSATFANLEGGQYTAIARQSDEAGNVGRSETGTFTVAIAPATTAAAPSPPVASFTWVPASPTVGQGVSLVSNSTDASSPIGAFAWDVAGAGQFAPGGPVMSTSFATPGPHVVQLRVTDANGLSSVATQTIAVAAATLKLMQPFPIVRIAGSETSNGVKIRLLTVQTPLSTTVVVSCKGRGCKTKSERRVATASSKSKSRAGAVLLTFNRFQRALRAGAVLQVRVYKAGQIGKFTSFTVRRHKLPLRSDRCLRPTSPIPIACPVS